MSETLAVEIKNLKKVFSSSFLSKKKIVATNDLSLEIADGEVYSLIGPNGSGKSTTMKVLLGLQSPTAGTCKIYGKSSLHVDSRKEVGYLPENPYFYKHLTGLETLQFYGKLCELFGRQLSDRVNELLAFVGLEHARNQKVGTFSKGMLQRIGLAQSLIHRPRLLILDEPTAGVDPVGSQEIKELILSLKKEGKTVFLCSHLLEQVQEVCDRVGIIFSGEMKYQGTLDHLVSIKDQLALTVSGSEKAQRKLLSQIQESAELKLEKYGQPQQSLESLFIQMAEESHKTPP